LPGSGGTSGGGGSVAALPPTTFVFERKVANGNDHLVAMDCVSGEQRVITTLADGSVAGYKIDGATVSPDRTRVVISSLFGPTAEDNATGVATNRLWSLDMSGGDFRRLTPVFPNNHPGASSWGIDVRDPAYSPDGQFVVFDYGEGNGQSGYVAPWIVSSAGGSLPSLFQTGLDCSVNGNAAFNPVTGDMLLMHVVCIGGVKGGYYLYPKQGGAPDYLVNEQGASLSSEPPAFSFDGSVFVYSARAYADNIQSLYAYVMSERKVAPLVLGAQGMDIVNAAFSPDNAHMVYCVRQGDVYNLRVIDLSLNPPTDKALTNDGVSCDAVF
jgi:Tol biopolymer transport system component